MSHIGRSMTDAELSKKILLFAEALTGRKFFPHQLQFAKRIVTAVLTNDSNTITSLMSRQSGKSFTVSATVSSLLVILPILANMPMFLDDKRFQLFQNGIMVGVFAPTLTQSQIIFNNIKEFYRITILCL